MQRRTFLASSLALSSAVAGATSPNSPIMKNDLPGNFLISLKGDAIGLEAGAMGQLEKASEVGFAALSVPAEWLSEWTPKQKTAFARRAEKLGIQWGAGGLPVEFRKSEDRFRSDLAALPAHAANLAEIGVTRIGTWIISSHDELTYNENLRRHADRLRDAARILGQNGIQLGLEYLGTTALRHAGRFAFLSSGRELRELIALIGEPNVGVILDSYHWYTARESAADLKAWKPEQIVAVDLNDANAQLALDDQTDVARELPGATGVIDITTFLQTLHEIGYTGPVRAEPFSQTLNGMNDDLALRATYASVTGAIQEALR